MELFRLQPKWPSYERNIKIIEPIILDVPSLLQDNENVLYSQSP